MMPNSMRFHTLELQNEHWTLFLIHFDGFYALKHSQNCLKFSKSGNTNVRLRNTRFTGILQSGTAICSRVMFFGAFQRSWVC